jgi:hypothetical protein
MRVPDPWLLEPIIRTTVFLKARIISAGKGSGVLVGVGCKVGNGLGVTVGGVVGVGEAMGVRAGVGTAVAVGTDVGVPVDTEVDVGVGIGIGVEVGVPPASQATRNNTSNQVTGRRYLHNLMEKEPSLRTACNHRMGHLPPRGG